MKTVLTTLGISLLVLAGCAGQKQAESNFIQENIDNAVAQEPIQTDIIEKSGKILNPRTRSGCRWQRSIPRIWIRYNTLPGTMMWAL